MKYLILLTLLLLPLTMAGIGTFEENKNIELYQTCDNCTYGNITSIYAPNGTSILQNKIMVQDGTRYSYELTSNYTKQIGIYQYCYDLGNTQEKETGCINFEITKDGKQNKSLEYVIIWIMSFIFLYFIFCNRMKEVPLYKLTGHILIMLNGILGIIIFDSPIVAILALSGVLYGFIGLISFARGIME